MNTRSKKVLRAGIILLCAGLFYAFFLLRSGVGIPCLFYRLTGFKCPGCGVSRMCLALLRGDFGEAFRQNRAVLMLLPAGVYLAVSWCIGYIRSGSRLLCGASKWVAWGMVVVLVAFGVARNFLGW